MSKRAIAFMLVLLLITSSLSLPFTVFAEENNTGRLFKEDNAGSLLEENNAGSLLEEDNADSLIEEEQLQPDEETFIEAEDEFVISEEETESAENEGILQKEEEKTAKRTILMYVCGTDLESGASMATHNFKQILGSSFSDDEDINLIIMTGGSRAWMLDDDKDPGNENPYLYFPEDITVPDDAVSGGDPEKPANPKGRISNEYNQVWEAKGADAAQNAGKLVLLDGDGLTGKAGEAVPSEKELMTEPDTLKAFINYGVEHYPAEKYDLIFWDHGGGPHGGYGSDEHSMGSNMPFSGIVKALKDNRVTDSDGDGTTDRKFDFVDFDCCLMGSVELALVLADYTEFYIASADTEPGFGQNYGPGEGNSAGWLDELGDPVRGQIYNEENGTFELGKVIVDNMNAFYSKDEGPGSGQHATLAVFDTEKMIAPETGFVSALNELSQMLQRQADPEDPEDGTALLFYDEIKSYSKTIHYADSQLFDLGVLTAFLGIADTELDKDSPSLKNAYTDLSEKFRLIFRNEGNQVQNDFMYASCTLDEKTEPDAFYRPREEAPGEIADYGILFSTGLSIFFPDSDNQYTAVSYFEEMDPVLELMPVKDDRYQFLKDYEATVADYAIILSTARAVSELLNNEYAFGVPDNDNENGKNDALGAKDKVNYDLVMKYWTNEDQNIWDGIISKFFNKKAGGAAGAKEWIERLIVQITDDAITEDNIIVSEVQYQDDVGYKIKINQSAKRIVGSVERNIDAELPALKAYIDGLPEKDQKRLKKYRRFGIGSFEGMLGDFPENASAEEMIDWYKEAGSTWDLEPLQQNWYAIKDGAGDYHAATIYSRKQSMIAVPALYGTEADGEPAERLVYLEFSALQDPNNNYPLKSLYFKNLNGSTVRIDPSTLTEPVSVMPVLYINLSSRRKYYAPVSQTPVGINKDNAGSITLDFTDVRSIPDIHDMTGDGKALNSTFSLTDIYGYKMDITDKVQEAKGDALKSISLASVEPAVYTGKELVPVVTRNGQVLKEGEDYTWEKVNDVIIDESGRETCVRPEFKKAGKYKVLLTGKGSFTGISYKSFRIKKAVNPLSVKGKTVTVSLAKLKKAAQYLTVSKVLTYVNKGRGTRSFTLVSAVKGTNSFKKYFSVNAGTGKITVKKGLGKGLYKLRVKVTAAGTSNFYKTTKSAVIRIRIR